MIATVPSAATFRAYVSPAMPLPMTRKSYLRCDLPAMTCLNRIYRLLSASLLHKTVARTKMKPRFEFIFDQAQPDAVLQAPSRLGSPDAELLDAYSHAVATTAEKGSPAVV